MGVAYSPSTAELYLGMTNIAAYRNGVRISCNHRHHDARHENTTTTINKTLSNAVVGFGFGYVQSDQVKDIDIMVGAVERLLKFGCRATRSYGCGVLDLCYVASGRIDVVYTGMGGEGWKPWDYCAAMVVVEEAGCVIRSLKGDSNENTEYDEDGHVIAGSKFDIYSSSMICGVNATVVEQCRRVVLEQ